MKQIKRYLILLIMISLTTSFSVGAKVINNVFETTMEITVISDSSFLLTISLDVEYDLSGLSANLKYDNTKLRLVEGECLNKFSCIFGENGAIVATRNKTISGNFEFATIEFEVLDGFLSDVTTRISLEEIKGSDNTVGLLSYADLSRKKEGEEYVMDVETGTVVSNAVPSTVPDTGEGINNWLSAFVSTPIIAIVFCSILFVFRRKFRRNNSD